MNTPQNDGGPITASMMTTVGPMDAIGGLSIRDWFAGQALAGLCSSPEMLAGYARGGENMAAKGCYKFADAMLLARLNKPEALRAGE
jgi:hypothetical protein